MVEYEDAELRRKEIQSMRSRNERRYKRDSESGREPGGKAAARFLRSLENLATLWYRAGVSIVTKQCKVLARECQSSSYVRIFHFVNIGDVDIPEHSHECFGSVTLYYKGVESV